MNKRLFFSIAALSGFISVLAGAFGAHGLEGKVSPKELAAFQTAAEYQMYHALALVAVSLLSERYPSRSLIISGWFFVVGTILFSGSLYVLGATGSRALVFITPIGGTAFLIGWVALFFAVSRLWKK
ncbi:MAG: DUF423 domain-containing protein [Nitrospinota bacterium]|nr:DUF423 domain-containing protein [Nitrospinota bacterium]